MTMILYSSTSAKSPVISMVMGDFCYVKVLNSGVVIWIGTGEQFLRNLYTPASLFPEKSFLLIVPAIFLSVL